MIDLAFDMCVKVPTKTLNPNQKSCVENVIDRYVDTMYIIYIFAINIYFIGILLVNQLLVNNKYYYFLYIECLISDYKEYIKKY